MAETKKLADTEWKSYFDRLSKKNSLGTVEVEVLGTDLGNQIEAEWQPLAGVTYDARSRRIDVIMDVPEGAANHAIINPKAVFVLEGEGEMPSTVEIVDEENNRHILSFRTGEQPRRTGTGL